MVQFRNTQTISFRRWVRKKNSVAVLAFQFPEEGLDHLRILWKTPDAKAGEWYVKTGIDTLSPRVHIMTDEHFRSMYRRPSHGSRPVVLSEEEWNTRYSRSLLTEEENG
jgi:hypothetical protein